MDVSDVVRRLWHRRWAVALVVLLALGAGLAGAVTSGKTLQSSAAVLIVPPPLGDAVSEQNPLLNLDNNLAQLATVLASAMQSSDVDDALAAAGADGSFTISTVTGTNPSFAQLSPQLVFTVTAPDASSAELTARVLVEQAGDQLTSLQGEASVPLIARATLVQVVAPTAAVVDDSGRLRSAGAFGLVTLVVGLLVVLVVDEVLRRRAVRGSAGSSRGSSEPTPRQAKAARVAAAQAARDARRTVPAAEPVAPVTDAVAPVTKADPVVKGAGNTTSTQTKAKAKAKAPAGTGARTGGNRGGSTGTTRSGGSGGSRSRRSR